MVFDILPGYNASYEVPVCQASVLLPASFRHPLTSLPLPLANASPYRAHRGLAPPSVSALPGAQRKRLEYASNLLIYNGGNYWIRTSDPLLVRQVLLTN